LLFRLGNIFAVFIEFMPHFYSSKYSVPTPLEFMKLAAILAAGLVRH
jgi:hypothetical protein